MAEFAHDSTLGSWFFQARPTGAVLDRMTKNARAAHWNKPRAVRYRETADIGTTQTEDSEDTHQLLLSGVRVIQGPQRGTIADGFDVNEIAWYGNPQMMFPTGQGLPPFVERPVVLSNPVGIKIVKTDPDDNDYSFVNWFGGLDWSQASGSTPEGIDFDVEQLLPNEDWFRCSIARPITISHTNQSAPHDLTVGLRWRIIFGRTGGTYDVPTVFTLGGRAGGYYIHWHAMGPVAAY